MKNFITTLMTTLCLGLFSLSAHAEQLIETEDYIVHYNAFNSTFVAPEVAQANNIVRSKYSAMLNIAVMEKQPSGGTKAVKALISGEVANRVQQIQVLRFKLISEGDAQYYLTDFTFADEDTLNFTVNIQPNPNKPAITLRFNQQFFTQ